MKSFLRAAPFVIMMALAACGASDAPRDKSELSVQPVRFHQSYRDVNSAGPLTFVRGFELSSKEKWFGGYSGMALSDDGTRARLVSDQSHWIDLAIELDEAGLPTDFYVAAGGPLRDENNVVQKGKQGDAESIIDMSAARDLSGPLLVAYERDHRIIAYNADMSVRGLWFRPALKMPDNGGLEAVARLPGGGTVWFSEQGRVPGHDELGPGWQLTPDGTLDTPANFERSGEYDPTDMARLPDGTLLVLERLFTPFTGMGVQIRRMTRGDDGVWRGPILVRLGGHYTIDNFESMDVRMVNDTVARLTIVSDDNYNRLQRTLFMIYDLDLGATPNN